MEYYCEEFLNTYIENFLCKAFHVNRDIDYIERDNF